MRLTEEQRLLRDTAREVAQNLLAPHSAEWDREARFPKEALAELGKLGFMGMLVPEQYGGGGADPLGSARGARGNPAGGRRLSTPLPGPKAVARPPLLNHPAARQQHR